MKRLDIELNKLKSHPALLQLFVKYLPDLKKDGKNYAAKCLFHEGDNDPSFKIQQVDSVWLFKCFGCNLGGSIIDFVMKAEKCNLNTAVKKIQQFLSGTFESKKQEVERVFQPIGNGSKKLLTMSLEAYRPFEIALENSKEAQDYLNNRGIILETTKKLHIGFRQDIGSLAGESNKDITNKGWLVFPYLENGQIVFIKYRSIVKKAFAAQPGMKITLFNMEH